MKRKHNDKIPQRLDDLLIACAQTLLVAAASLQSYADGAKVEVDPVCWPTSLGGTADWLPSPEEVLSEWQPGEKPGPMMITARRLGN